MPGRDCESSIARADKLIAESVESLMQRAQRGTSRYAGCEGIETHGYPYLVQVCRLGTVSAVVSVIEQSQ